jgi:hypothetical protein
MFFLATFAGGFLLVPAILLTVDATILQHVLVKTPEFEIAITDQ